MTVPPPDRATIVAAVMDDLLAIHIEPDDDAVGTARIIATTGGVYAGTSVVREIAARVGVRTRPLVAEGEQVGDARLVL